MIIDNYIKIIYIFCIYKWELPVAHVVHVHLVIRKGQKPIK